MFLQTNDRQPKCMCPPLKYCFLQIILSMYYHQTKYFFHSHAFFHERNHPHILLHLAMFQHLSRAVCLLTSFFHFLHRLNDDKFHAHGLYYLSSYLRIHRRHHELFFIFKLFLNFKAHLLIYHSILKQI